MTIYIWLLWHSVAIMCANAYCSSVSMGHMDYLIGIGALEVVFEIAGVIKIFNKKDQEPTKPEGRGEISRIPKRRKDD